MFEQIPSGQKYLTPIIEAMRDGRSLEMTYKSFWRQSRYDTEVEPYFIKVFKQRWYMIARDVSRDVMRIYALDRIQGLSQTENAFEVPADFSPDAYFYNAFGVIVEDACPPEIIELKVYGTQREYFRTLPLHHSQEEIDLARTIPYSAIIWLRHMTLSRKSFPMAIMWRSNPRHISGNR